MLNKCAVLKARKDRQNLIKMKRGEEGVEAKGAGSLRHHTPIACRVKEQQPCERPQPAAGFANTRHSVMFNGRYAPVWFYPDGTF